MSFLECETLEADVKETEYITIPRWEYDDLVRAENKLELLMSALKANVMTSTLRRIAMCEEGAYKAGAAIGNFLTALGQGFSDSQTPDRSIGEGADAEAHFRGQNAD